MGQPHDYAKVAFDLIDDLDRLTEIDGVMSRVSATLAGFGYASFLITGVPEPPQRLEPYILLNEWPKGLDRALHSIKLLRRRSSGSLVSPHGESFRVVASAFRCGTLAARRPRSWRLLENLASIKVF